MGNTLIRLMITVAPQKDICPQGKTYPKNAEAMVRAMMVHPLSHGLAK
jgi:hypothetical protein